MKFVCSKLGVHHKDLVTWEKKNPKDWQVASFLVMQGFSNLGLFQVIMANPETLIRHFWALEKISALEGFDKVWKTLTLEHQRFLAEELMITLVANAWGGKDDQHNHQAEWWGIWSYYEDYEVHIWMM